MPENKDFFISYTSADVSWANWIAWELRDGGYTTIHQAWDFRPGANFVSEMKKALEGSERTIAVYSPNYFNSGFSEDEWTAAFADRSLLPVRVRECDIPKLLRPRVYIDLVNLAEEAARAALLAGLRRDGISPRERPQFPPDAEKRKRFPGGLPEVWEVPLPRNPNFTGRDQMLKDLRAALVSGRSAALTQAIAGLGGVGKTQLALEYCYRYAAEYSVVWWMRAEEPTSLASDYARLAVKLNLPEKDLANQSEIVAGVRAWLERHPGWLLIFDNATGPESCADYLPHGGNGHILITSRNPAWRGIGERIRVQQLARTESVAFLIKRTGKDEPSAAEALSKTVGDLPLALAHAAAYIDANEISIQNYVELLGNYSKDLLEPVEKTWVLAFEKVDESASDLLNLIAYLAPDNIPRDLLKSTAANPLALNKSIEALRRYSLIEAGTESINVHRLVQQVTRGRLSGEEQRRWAEAAVELVNENFEDPLDYRNWPACAKLLAHALDAARHAEELTAGQEATGHLLNKAGLYEKQQAQLRSAEQLMRSALEISEKVYGPNHTKVAIRANNLGQILQAQGDLGGALHHTRRALEIDEKVYGPDHPDVATDASNLGQILRQQGDLAGALQYARRALKIDEEVYGPDHPTVAILTNNLGSILQEQGDLDGALQHTLRALEIGQKFYGPDHPDVAIWANNLGRILHARGDLDGALRYTRQALEIDEKIYGPDHHSVARDANSLGTILKEQGDLAGALQYTRRALSILESTYGPDHPNTRTVAENLRVLESESP